MSRPGRDFRTPRPPRPRSGEEEPSSPAPVHGSGAAAPWHTEGDRFDERVYALVRRVPRGRVITYGAVAALLGEPRKAREVGWAMFACPDDVPAHRVINRLGAVSGGPSRADADRRRRRLEAEGVVFGPDGRCDLEAYEWAPPDEP